MDDLIEGVSSDLKSNVHLRSVKDLLVYSYRVAGTVGIMMAKILNVNDTRSLKGAVDLGIAMQLTNIARDVIEDKKMNRQYIKPDFENIEATLKLADRSSDPPSDIAYSVSCFDLKLNEKFIESE